MLSKLTYSIANLNMAYQAKNIDSEKYGLAQKASSRPARSDGFIVSKYSQTGSYSSL